MPIAVRPFTPDDYPACSQIASTVYPAYAFSADELRYRDEHLDPKCRWSRWMASLDGEAVGFGYFGQIPWAYDPHAFHIMVQVLPARRARGVGRTLYDAVLEGLRPYDPNVLRTMTNESETDSIAFVERRGFKEEQRSWESRLDIQAFDAAPYAGLEGELARQGITLHTLREIRETPGWDRKLYDLFWAVEQSIPTNEPFTRVSFETLMDYVEKDPASLPDGFIIATHGDELIGLSNLRKNAATPDVSTGLTGVDPRWRGRKIALAMKVRALDWARSEGYPMTKTWNDSRNQKMLEINQRLGFVRLPAWVQFVKHLGSQG